MIHKFINLESIKIIRNFKNKKELNNIKASQEIYSLIEIEKIFFPDSHYAIYLM